MYLSLPRILHDWLLLAGAHEYTTLRIGFGRLRGHVIGSNRVAAGVGGGGGSSGARSNTTGSSSVFRFLLRLPLVVEAWQ